MPFLENCDDALNRLAKSPTFAMSLGAKELFHTNFLAFLLETEVEELACVRQNLISLFFGENPPSRVLTWREKQNFDLIILPVPENGRPLPTKGVLIEAKLKSIPTRRQLDQYTQKFRRDKGVDFQFDDDGIQRTFETPNAQIEYR